jgi:uncharacterized iron-regulated membrane protein
MNRNNLRKWINNLHLWLGLASGLILFVVCLSGTVYTFRAEIERWIDAEKFYAKEQQGKILPADTIALRAAEQAGGKVTAMTIPADHRMNWQVTLKKEKPAVKGSDSQPGETRPQTIFIDPYSGNKAGEQGGPTSEFFSTLMKLHRWLLMGDSIGRIIVGTATIIFVFMLLSGIILWFPAKLRLIRQALTVKTSANWKRINHDLHNTLGFYSFLVLLVMALTGLCWSFEWYRDGASEVLGAKVFRGRGENPAQSKIPASGVRHASLDEIIVSTNKVFDYSGNLRLSIPENDSNAVAVTKSAVGFFASAGVDKIQFDRFSGEALRTEPFKEKPLNVKVADSIKLIHTGEIFGTFSKLIYFVVCLIATSLPVTGTMIWLNKMKKKSNSPAVRVRKGPQFA